MIMKMFQVYRVDTGHGPEELPRLAAQAVGAADIQAV